MFRPTLNEIKALLENVPAEEIVDLYVLAGPCYYATQEPRGFEAIKTHIAVRLSVDFDNISLVGSGKLGYSVNPDYWPLKFASHSDLDILIVDDRLFDLIWLCLIYWRNSKPGWLRDDDHIWLTSLLKEKLLPGWFYTNEIGPARIRGSEFLEELKEIQYKWRTAFATLTGYTEYSFSRRRVTGVLYRTWEHARLRQIDRIRRLKHKHLNS